MDSDKEILRGRLYRGTSILYKIHLAKYVTIILCQIRRMPAIKVVMENYIESAVYYFQFICLVIILVIF